MSDIVELNAHIVDGLDRRTIKDPTLRAILFDPPIETTDKEYNEFAKVTMKKFRRLFKKMQDEGKV